MRWHTDKFLGATVYPQYVPGRELGTQFSPKTSEIKKGKQYEQRFLHCGPGCRRDCRPVVLWPALRHRSQALRLQRRVPSGHWWPMHFDRLRLPQPFRRRLERVRQDGSPRAVNDGQCLRSFPRGRDQSAVRLDSAALKFGKQSQGGVAVFRIHLFWQGDTQVGCGHCGRHRVTRNRHGRYSLKRTTKAQVKPAHPFRPRRLRALCLWNRLLWPLPKNLLPDGPRRIRTGNRAPAKRGSGAGSQWGAEC